MDKGNAINSERRGASRLDVEQWLLEKHNISAPLCTLPEPIQTRLRGEYLSDLHWHCRQPSQIGSPSLLSGCKRDPRFWSDAASSLEIFIKKHVAHRRAWGTFTKVIPPTAPERPYTVILEREGMVEQFSLKDEDVARFATTGNDLSFSTEILAALQHLDNCTKR